MTKFARDKYFCLAVLAHYSHTIFITDTGVI